MIKYGYGNKKFKLIPYNTNQEKLILLYGVDDLTCDSALDILKNNIITEEKITDFTDKEKLAILLKFREISVGESINIKYKCPHCNNITSSELNISNIVTDKKITDFKDIKLQEAFSSDNDDYFIDKNIIDDIDIDLYDEIDEYIENNKVKFNFKQDCSCGVCNAIKNIDYSSPKFILDNMSESDISLIYKITSELIFNSHYTKKDVDSMLPFERDIFVGLLNQHIENKLS